MSLLDDGTEPHWLSSRASSPTGQTALIRQLYVRFAPQAFVRQMAPQERVSISRAAQDTWAVLRALDGGRPRRPGSSAPSPALEPEASSGASDQTAAYGTAPADRVSDRELVPVSPPRS